MQVAREISYRILSRLPSPLSNVNAFLAPSVHLFFFFFFLFVVRYYPLALASYKSVRMRRESRPRLLLEEGRIKGQISEYSNSSRSPLFLHARTHYATLHYTTIYYIILHYTTLYYTTLRYATLQYTILHYYVILHHYTTLRYVTLHYTTLHYTTLYYIII